MKKAILLGIILSLLSCQHEPAFAQESPIIYGPGATYCRDIKTDFVIKFLWVQGYVSENNVLTWIQSHQKFNPLPKEFGVGKQAQFIGEFCLANPDKDISDAADALIQRLKAMDALGGQQ